MKKIKWLLPLSLVAGSTGLTAVSCTETSYSIEYDITNGHCEGPTKIGKKDEITIKIIPDEHYALPSKISVSNAEYDYDKTTGEIKIWNAQDNIVVSATCIDKAIPISISVRNGTYEGPSIIYPGDTATISFIPNQYFTYPKIGDISVIGAEIESYIPETGELTIGNVWTLVGEVLITTDCQAIPFAITCSVNNGSWEGSTVVSHNKPATIQINPSQYYSYPETVTVTNADYTYDNKTGKVTISNPTGDVNVTATCEWDKQYHHVITTPTGCTIEGSDIMKDGEQYTFVIKPFEKHVLPSPNGVSCTNARLVKYDYNTGELILAPSGEVGDISIAVDCKEGYKVDLTPIHCTIIGKGGIEKGGSWIYGIQPEEGYALPADTSTIIVDNANIDFYEIDTKANVANLKITAPADQPDDTVVAITVECEYIPKTFTISGDITNGSLTGATEITESSDATVTIVPDSEHIAPASKADIHVDNAAIKSYSASTGELVITSPKGNVTVEATCPDKPEKFPLIMSVTNGKSDHTDITEIAPDETLVFTITPNQYCVLPDTVTVTGASYTYDKATGKLTVSAPTSAVEINIGCDKIINSVSVNGDNVLAYSTKYTYDVKVEFVEGKETGYTVTCDVGSTGCKWDTATKTLTAGSSNCSVDIVVTFPSYGFTYTYTVRVYETIFTFGFGTAKGTSTAKVLGTTLPSDVQGAIVTIPDSVYNDETKTSCPVVEVYERKLEQIKTFKQITFPASMWQIDFKSFAESSIENIVFNENSQLEGITGNAFWNSGLKGHIVIKSKLSTPSNIGPEAFKDCHGITAITLPANLNHIYERAFYNCDHLTAVYFDGTTAQWKAIERGDEWHTYVKATQVVCSNGSCGLDDK